MPAGGLGPVEKNLAWRAALAFFEATGWSTGFAIEIDKRIPVGGGLGGGSADAGGVLRALNAMAPAPLSAHGLLAIAAERLQLGEIVRFGRGEEKTGGRKKKALLANTLEAVIAAVFIDGGYIPARHFIATLFAEELKTVSPKSSVDFKTLPQEV